MAADSPAKVCQMCKQDCSNRPRTKDANGLYWCNECLAKRGAAGAGGAAPKRSVERTSPSAASSPPRGGAGSRGNEAPDYLWGGASTAAKGAPCPSCKTFMREDAVICTQCGYSVKLGRRLGTKIAKAREKDAAKGKPKK